MNVSHSDSAYRDILERADVVYCDGEGVRLGAWLAGQSIPERMTGADWIEPLCALAVREDLSLFLLGGEPGVADEAATILRARHPGLRIRGTASGYSAGSAAIQAINLCRPDIVLIGMGTPTQEKWIAAHRADLDVPVVWAVGALFDFVAGRIPRGPRWMTQHGLEWFCRLTAEPRKLWRRYLIGNPRFLIRVITHYYLGSHRVHRPAL
jgi:N-acetylglucosaminyldiphosphoundecaprenol N-acetyl-beta-D-mannosaminyltransferase